MSNKQEKIVAARLRLRKRFMESMQNSPSLSDANPMGSGPPNRHGMPTLPPGQSETQKWPVLDLGVHPEIAAEEWKMEIRGECDAPFTLSYAQLKDYEEVVEASDFHCVTKWSKMNIEFRGLRLSDLLAQAQPKESATHLMCYGYDGYSTNISLAEALKPDVLLAYGAEGKLLAKEHGGPVRMITPQLYAWKGSKWISAIEFMNEDRPGFWEQNGYSMTAYPWREDRYSLK